MGKILLVIILAHSWYPVECCSDGDCREVPCSEMNLETGEWQGKLPRSKRASQDGKCHVCVGSGGLGPFYCVFVPEANS